MTECEGCRAPRTLILFVTSRTRYDSDDEVADWLAAASTAFAVVVRMGHRPLEGVLGCDGPVGVGVACGLGRQWGMESAGLRVSQWPSLSIEGEGARSGLVPGTRAASATCPATPRNS